MDKRRGILYRLLLVCFSLAVAFLILESAFRMKAVLDDRRRGRAFAALGQTRRPPEGAVAHLKDLVRFSADPRLIYELIPNLSVLFKGRPLHTDAEGFRLTGRRPTGRAATVRVVGLGDSFMFGWGLSDPECYLALLKDRLNREMPDTTWEVINAAVPGYNTAMEVEMLKSKLLTRPPDIVLLHFVINDLDLPNFICRRTSILSLRRSFFLEFLSAGYGRTCRGSEKLEEVPFNPLEKRFEYDAKDAPEEYKDIVGLDAFCASMTELKNLSDRYGFRVLVLCDFTAPEYVRTACRERQFPLVETQEAVMGWMRKHLGKKDISLDDYFDSPLVLSRADTHPSAEGHRIIADLLFEKVESLGAAGSANPR
jgi:lysophospholipase L1-like esterase